MSIRRRPSRPGLTRRRVRLFAVLLVAPITLLAPITLGSVTAVAGSGDGTLTVVVVRDVNGNGTHEPSLEGGVEGIGVEVTDGIGGVSSAVTGADGSASIDLDPLSGGRYRVRTATPVLTKPYLQQTLVSLAATPGRLAPATSFVDVSDGADVTQTVALWDPDDYVGPDPRYVTTEQPRGWDGGLSLEPALVSFPADQRGSGGISTEATWNQIGSAYGLAFDRVARTVYVGALAKRYSGYGPGGGGAIYAFDVDAGALRPFATVPDAAPTAHGSDITVDAGFVDVPGKEGLGDLELSPDGRSLFAVGLRDKTLYRFPLDGGEPQKLAIPAPEQISSPDDWRPFALGTGNGKLYVGGVDSAQSSGDPGDLAVTVYEVTGATAPLLSTAGFVPALHGQLGGELRGDVFDRGTAGKDVRSHWHPWTVDPVREPGANSGMGTGLVIYPQPELTDIEFDNDGSMLLGFRDRTSDQVGYQDVDGSFNNTMSGGDLVKACGPVDGPWTIEYESDSPRCASNADPARDGGQQGSPHEFFIGDFLRSVHQETALGGLRVNKSAGDVASTSMDPAGRVNVNGVGWFSQLTGEGPGNEPVEQNGLILVDDRTTGFGKGNGLGDLELIVDQAPVQIGNYVWFDTDRDGTQDADEPPVEGATVHLLDADGTVLATTTTDANGEYYFNESDGLAPDTEYRVEFDWSTGTLFGQPIPEHSAYTTPNAESAGVTVDSDAIVGDVPTIGHTDVAPLRTGQVNHDYDAGINPPVPGYELAKTSDPGDGVPVEAGQPIHYTLTGTNTGQTVLDPVEVSDDLSGVLDDAQLSGDIRLQVLDAGGQVVSERTLTLNADRDGDGTPDGFTADTALQVGQRVVVTYTLTAAPGGDGVAGNAAGGSAQPPSPVPPGPCCQVTPPPITPEPVHTTHPVTAPPAPGGEGPGGGAPPGKKPAPPAPAPDTGTEQDEGGLASTGVAVLAPLGAAAALVAAGTATLVITRRRRAGRQE